MFTNKKALVKKGKQRMVHTDVGKQRGKKKGIVSKTTKNGNKK